MVTAAMKLKDAYSLEPCIQMGISFLFSFPFVSWTIKKLSTEKFMLLNYGVGEDS